MNTTHTFVYSYLKLVDSNLHSYYKHIIAIYKHSIATDKCRYTTLSSYIEHHSHHMLHACLLPAIKNLHVTVSPLDSYQTHSWTGHWEDKWFCTVQGCRSSSRYSVHSTFTSCIL